MGLGEVWERFKEFRPKTNLIKIGEPRCAQWHKQMTGVGNVRTILDSAGVSFDWRPYAKPLNNWNLPEFYAEKEMSVSVDADLPEEFLSFAFCLRTSELVGLDCVENYFPHRVAMQFGIDQDLPGCVARANDTHVAWNCYSKPITCETLYIPPRLYEAGVTTRYSEWWKQSKLSSKFESEALLPIKKALPSVLSTPRRSKAAKVSSLVGSKKRLKRTTESSCTMSTEVSVKRLDGVNEGDGTPFCSSSSLKSSEKSSKKKDIYVAVTLGKQVETSKEKERVCDVSASSVLSSEKLPLSLLAKELNDSPVPPGFAPKFNLEETRDSVDKDDPTIAEY